MLESIQQTFVQMTEVFSSYLPNLGWNPLAWNGTVWISLIALVLLIRFFIRYSQRNTRPSRRPELLVSKGVIQQPEHRPTQVLSLKVSNLNDYPIQLLEIALQSDLMSSPYMVEAAEILAPHSAVELEAVLPNNIVGDSGSLNIYVYSNKRKRKMYRLKSQFDWEPWSSRYKVEATGQRMRAVKQLASTKLSRERKKDWHQQKLKTQPLVVNHDAEPQEEWLEPPPRRITPQLDAEFPSEF